MQKNAGFTLIELLVAVLIICILAALAVPQYQKAVLKSRFMSFMPVARTLAEAQEIYYMANGKYAFDVRQLDVQIPPDCRLRGQGSYNEILCGTDWLLDNVSQVDGNDKKALGWMRVCYCPGENTAGSSSCPRVADACLFFYYARNGNTDERFKCSARTQQGTLLCHTFEGIF